MASKNTEKRFGLSTTVDEHMAVLRVLAKNDNEAIGRFWKNSNSDASKKAMLFHTLAMLDPERLHAWIASTPTAWWEKGQQDKTDAGVYGRYDTMAGGLLNHLHLANRPVFMQLLEKSPYMFKANSCRFYVDEWCKDSSKEELAAFQFILLSQSPSWYVTHPWRTMLLTSLPSVQAQECMLAAATAKNGVLNPLLEERFPGISACIGVVEHMLGDTKQKKAYLRQWMINQIGPHQETLVMELPDMGMLD